MKIVKSIIFLGILVSFLCSIGCESMDDNYAQYKKEYNYSGKIDSLRVYPGYERVTLAWDNPKDQKSKTIRIVYGADSTVVEYDTLVDSVSIEGLNAGTGYEFTVYTLDSYKNISVPTSITAFPVSKDFVEALTPPSILVQVIGADQYISLVGLSNVLMKFAGNIEYIITGPGGFSTSGAVDLVDMIGKSDVNIPVAPLGVQFLPPGDYNFEYKVSVWPILSNLTSIDEVFLENTSTVTVNPAVVNLMNVTGVVSESNNNSPSAESVDKIIDNNPNTKYLTRVNTAWIMWKMNRPFAATYYTLTSANDGPDRDPRDWQVEASNDGANWTVIDKQTGVDAFPSRFLKRTYYMANRTAYTHYRLNVTKNNGASIFQLADWILYYDSGQ